MNTEESNVFYRDWRRSFPVAVRAEGAYIWDSDGNQYLDASGGPVVVNIGHGVKDVLEAMRVQAEKICYAYGLQFTSEPQEQLATALADFAPGDLNRVFFVSGGSEGTETAIKMARRYFIARGDPARYKVIARWRSYHGNTFGALSASGHVLRRRDYSPYLLNFSHIRPPYRYRCELCANAGSCTLACADDLERCIMTEGPGEVAAFICEPVVGSSVPGLVPAPGYYERIRQICDEYGVLFIADEVLCGVGRTGRNFAIEHWHVTPDIVVAGKGLCSGYSPLGVVIVSEALHAVMREGNLDPEPGFTYGGNPLSCATGLAVLQYIQKHELVQRVADVGDYFVSKLREELSELPLVGDVDGLGLLAGIELVSDRETKAPFPRALGVSRRVVDACFEQGVIILGGSGGQADGINGDRLEIAPPYIITPDEIDRIAATLRDVIQEVGAQVQPATQAVA